MRPDDEGPALPIACPYCGRTNEAHWEVTAPATPEAGHVGVCVWGCGNLFVYESATAVRRPAAEELVELVADPRVALTLVICGLARTPSEAVALTRRVFAAPARLLEPARAGP